MIPNPFQTSAIQNGANKNTLVNQLFSGNTASKSPGVMASANNVPNANAPAPGASALAQGITLGVSTPTIGGQPLGGYFSGFNTPTTQGAPQFSITTAPPALGSLGTTPVVKHTIAADGTQSVTHAPADTTTSSTSSPNTQATTNQPAPLPAYNPTGGPSDTVYHNGVATMYQNGQPVSAPASSSSSQPTQTPQTPTTPVTSPNGNPYTGLLAGTAQAGSSTASTAATGLLGTAATNPGNSGPAYDDYQSAVNDLNTLQKQYADFKAGIGGEAVPFAVRQGEQAQVDQKYNDQLTAAQAKVSEKQAALNYQITGTQTQQSGLNEAGTLANASQGLIQSGLSSASSLAQPSGSYPFVFNPNTGQYTNASTGGVANANDLAGEVLSGKIPYNQAVSALGYLGGTGEAQLISAIKQQNPNADLTQLQAQVAGSAAGTQAVAAVPGQTQAGVYGSQQTQVAQYQSALQQGQNLQSQLSDLITTFGLNPSDLNAANTGIQKIAQNTSSPQYKILQNYVNDVANTYAQVLTPPGGSATDTSRGIATSMLDSTAKGTSILQVMQSLDAAAKAKIAGIPTSQAGSSSNSGGSGTVQTKYGAINTGWN